jgi:predicted RNase H-like nuclease (RuvC/YqgF family)
MRFERVEKIRGHRYIRLKSGRLFSYRDAHTASKRGDAHTASKRAESDLVRAVSRTLKLADDHDLQELEWFVEGLHEYVHALDKEVERRQDVKMQERRIESLRNTTGRAPAEVQTFERKANELEKQLTDERNRWK